MKKHTLILSVVGALTRSSTANAIPTPNKAEHTVSWYSTHRDDDIKVLKECRNDRTFEFYPDCINAVHGDELWYAHSLLDQNKTATNSHLNVPSNQADDAKKIQEKNR